MFLSKHPHVSSFAFPSFMKNMGMLFLKVLFSREKRLANHKDNLKKRNPVEIFERKIMLFCHFGRSR